MRKLPSAPTLTKNDPAGACARDKSHHVSNATTALKQPHCQARCHVSRASPSEQAAAHQRCSGSLSVPSDIADRICGKKVLPQVKLFKLQCSLKCVGVTLPDGS